MWWTTLGEAKIIYALFNLKILAPKLFASFWRFNTYIILSTVYWHPFTLSMISIRSKLMNPKEFESRYILKYRYILLSLLWEIHALFPSINSQANTLLVRIFLRLSNTNTDSNIFDWFATSKSLCFV